MGNPQQLINK